MISQAQLQKGYKKGRELVFRLYDDNEFFYRKKQYSTSISISILIREELTKLNLIRNHIVNNSIISKKEWDSVSRLGSHNFKLKKPYVDALEKVNTMGKHGYDRVVNMEKTHGTSQEFDSFSKISIENELINNRLNALNKIKQSCWYLDWQNSQWVVLSSIYSSKELELFANYLLQLTGYDYVNEILNYKYPFNFYHEVPPEVSLIRRDPLWGKREEFYKLIKSNNFKKIIMLSNNILDTYSDKITESNSTKSENKNTWPIPKKSLLNGAILALKNSKKLLKDSQHACQNNRYSISLTLAVLSFEEFGKHFLLRKSLDNNQDITPKIWFSKFTKHSIKLNAMLDYLESPTEKQKKSDFEQDANELSSLITNWRHNKLNAIYLNWSKINNQWYTFDDLPLSQRKEEAELAIHIINRFFAMYVDETRNPNFLTIEELGNLIKSSKLYFECEDCNKSLKLQDEIVIHEKNYPNHRVGFHFS